MSEHSRRLRAINEFVQRSLEEGKPMLGVFWLHPKTKQMIAPYPEPVEHGSHDKEMGVVDANTRHADLWHAVKDYHPDLSHLRYDEVPRGRVYLNTDTKKYHVFGSEEHINDPQVQRQVRSKFNLPKPPHTVFEPSEDYETHIGGPMHGKFRD